MKESGRSPQVSLQCVCVQKFCGVGWEGMAGKVHIDVTSPGHVGAGSKFEARVLVPATGLLRARVVRDSKGHGPCIAVCSRCTVHLAPTTSPTLNATMTSATPAETEQASRQMDAVPAPPSLPAPPSTAILTTSRSIPPPFSPARTDDQPSGTPNVLECQLYQLGLQDALEGRRHTFKAALGEVPPSDIIKVIATRAPAEALQFLGDYEAGWREGKGLRLAYELILALVPVLMFVWAVYLYRVLYLAKGSAEQCPGRG